jgi:hypothetical protein
LTGRIVAETGVEIPYNALDRKLTYEAQLIELLG